MGTLATFFKKFDRQTGMNGPIRCSSLTLKRVDHIKFQKFCGESLWESGHFEKKIEIDLRDTGCEDWEWK
jgi:hypothetical protein